MVKMNNKGWLQATSDGDKLRKMNNRGWLRIVEASIAVIILIGIAAIISSQGSNVQKDDLSRTIHPMLEELSKNDTLRAKILNFDENSDINSDLRNFINPRMRSDLNYTIQVCPVMSNCLILNKPGTRDIYSDELIITSNLTAYAPKKVKLYMWRL